MRALLAVSGVVAVVAIAGPAGASARNRAPIRSCGQIVFTVPHTDATTVTYVESIDVRRISCRRARAFVRSYERLADEGKLPNRPSGKTRRSVLVFYEWTRPYRVNAFVCRAMALPNVLVNAGRVTCGAPSGLVTWHETGHSG